MNLKSGVANCPECDDIIMADDWQNPAACVNCVNKEGLTFREWVAAAYCYGGPDPRGPYWSGALRRAWEDGEDPSDYAAYFKRKG